MRSPGTARRPPPDIRLGHRSRRGRSGTRPGVGAALALGSQRACSSSGPRWRRPWPRSATDPLPASRIRDAVTATRTASWQHPLARSDCLVGSAALAALDQTASSPHAWRPPCPTWPRRHRACGSCSATTRTTPATSSTRDTATVHQRRPGAGRGRGDRPRADPLGHRGDGERPSAQLLNHLHGRSSAATAATRLRPARCRPHRVRRDPGSSAPGRLGHRRRDRG